MPCYLGLRIDNCLDHAVEREEIVLERVNVKEDETFQFVVEFISRTHSVVVGLFRYIDVCINTGEFRDTRFQNPAQGRIDLDQLDEHIEIDLAKDDIVARDIIEYEMIDLFESALISNQVFIDDIITT